MLKQDCKLDWPNVSLAEYIELQNLMLDNEDGLAQEDLVMQNIQLLYGKDPYAMKMPEFRKCIESLGFMSKPMPKMKVKDSYVLNGNRYYLHKDLADFKVAQYIDYEQIMREKKGIESYAEFIALFLMPDEDCDYGDGYDVKTVVNDIERYMSIADACSISAFFLRLSKAYIVHFLLYSRRKATKAMKTRKAKREMRRKTRQMIRMVLHGV